jgi:uncharacterized protein with PIN domain
MGCFDYYLINCPHCNLEVEDQKKPGDMNTYRFGVDPKDDMEFAGFYNCYHCGKNFTVEMEIMPKMIVRKE